MDITEEKKRFFQEWVREYDGSMAGSSPKSGERMWAYIERLLNEQEAKHKEELEEAIDKATDTWGGDLSSESMNDLYKQFGVKE